MLITIEGIPGSGKTTLIENLKLLLTDMKPIYTSEPYGVLKKNIEHVKGGIYKTAIYSILSHVEHLEKLIEPKNDKNIIISDCFFDSIIANQSNIQQLDIMKMIEYQKKISIIPDITILLVCDPQVAYKRLIKSPAFDNDDFLKKVQENYIILAKMRPDVYILDTTTTPPDKIAWTVDLIIKQIVYSVSIDYTFNNSYSMGMSL